MKEIFKAFQARIAAQVPAIKYTDFDLGQLEVENPPVSFPCSLLSFSGSTSVQVSADNDAETLVVEIVIAFRLRERTSSVATDTYRDQAIDHIDTVTAVRQALSGLDGASFTPLTYRGFVLERRADLRVYRQRYESTFFEQPAADDFIPWPNDTGPDFCVHPDIQ